jgi:hypothetical protein
MTGSSLPPNPASSVSTSGSTHAPAFAFSVELTAEQLGVNVLALQLLSALSFGDTEQVANLIASGFIPTAEGGVVDQECAERIRRLLASVKTELGYGSQGLRAISRNRPEVTRRSHEMYFAMSNAQSVLNGYVKEDHPDAKRGLTFRVTDDPLPVVRRIGSLKP